MNNDTMSHTRRHCREWCVQLLFQLDFQTPEDMDVFFANFWADHPQPNQPTRDFTQQLMLDVCEHKEELDALISGASKQWNIERMGVVDRNVIRLAIYEINHRPDVPAAVSINEAVDIANYFSDDDSSRFVNGILDQILRNHSGASDREDPVTPG
ncbi:MAG: N utilization substance protein B [Candidatus Promineifilaceae bacterium]|jgi:transcription antitermination protein NusB